MPEPTGRNDVSPDMLPDTDWLDAMVKKLKETLWAQLTGMHEAPVAQTAQERSADARTLAGLERTLERLSNLERERAAIRETKIQKHDKAAAAALERRLDKLAGTGAKAKPARKPG